MTGLPKPILDEVIYKHTVVSDYVVKRHVRLYAECFVTVEDPIKKPDDYRVYPLHHTARLVPADAADITKKRRHIRPKGVHSLTALAALRGKGHQMELYTFKLEMKDAWDFRFCFETLEQAQRWHSALVTVIDDLRTAAGGAALEASSPSKGYSKQTNSELDAQSQRSSYLGSGGSSTDGSRRHIRLGDASFKEVQADVLHSSSFTTAEDEDAELATLLNFQTGVPSTTKRFHPRWVPYTHSNGLAIYQHQGKGGLEGDEYMVSAVIRGAPVDVLRALLDPGSATTILGPALEVEILDSAPGRQVMRIQLQALGKTAEWFRPREAVVQRLLKKEDDGVYVVLFSSIDTADAANADNSWQKEGVIEEAEGLGGSARLTHPIRCKVQGGYTISKLQGYRGSSSPESLLTCILQVKDMGGWLNRRHPLFRVVDWWSGGAYQAFLGRMLLGVTLVRDVVENSRFAVKQQAFSFQEAQQEAAAEEEEEGSAAPFLAVDSKAVPSVRTSTFVMRQAAADLHLSTSQLPGIGTPFAGVAGRPLSVSGPNLIRPAPRKVSRLASLRLPGGSGAVGSGGLPGSGRMPSALPPAAVVESELEEPEQEFKLPKKFYDEIHIPGKESPFKVRGASYLSDGRKVQAGQPMFELLGMELLDVGPGPCPHISRYLPSVRRSSKPFLFVYNLMVPGPPTMCCCLVFGSDSHPTELGPPPDDPEDSDWQPFDFLIWRFLHGDDEERKSLFKMIPRIAEGSWLIKQSVGTTPVIIGRKLATSFHITEKYVEVAVDVGSSSTAQYVTGMVRGGCRNLVLDLGLVLEGHHSWELPEVLMGAVRVIHLDLAAASKLDVSKEIPLRIIRTAQPAESAESSTAA